MNLISERISEWRGQLLDLTKRNQLINCKYGSRGAIQLLHPSSAQLWKQLVAGRKLEFPWRRDLVPPVTENGENEIHPTLEQCLASYGLASSDVLASLDDKLLDRRLRRLQLNARTSLSEQGVNNLFVAFGVLTWYEAPTSQEPISSPLVLLPAQVQQESAHQPWSLHLYEEEVVANHSLRQYLSENLHLEFPQFEESDLLDDLNALQMYYDSIADCVQHRDRWAVSDIALLGSFSFQKLAMWVDLDVNAESITNHNLCRAIAGEAEVTLNPEIKLPHPAEFDSVLDPRSLHSILDCDGSQLEAIVAAREGMSFVLDGPPGTGKSQTIANIIAEFLANGKRVLFVSEKSAALDVVKGRLDQNGLGDFCLDCHSHKANKKDVIHELGRCLELPGERYGDQESQLKELLDSREKVNKYAEAVHKVVQPLGLSPYQVHGLVSELEVCPRAKANIPNVMQRDAAWLEDVSELLKRLTVCEGYIDAPATHPWRNCKITTFSLTTLDDTRDLLEETCTAADALLSAHSQMNAFGFGIEGPRIAQIDALIGDVKTTLGFPLIPTEWLAVDTVADTADRIVAICEAHARVEELKGLSEVFRDAAMPSEDLLALLASTARPLARLLVQDSSRSVREQQEYLSTIEKQLESSIAVVDDVVGTVAEIATHLSVTLGRDTKLQLLPKLQGLALDVSRTTMMRPGWFRPETQHALLQTAEEYTELFASDVGGFLAFPDDVHDRVAPETVETILSDTWNQKIVDSLHVDTVRTLHDKLNSISGTLTRMQSLLDELRQDATELVRGFLENETQASISVSQLKLGTVTNLTDSIFSLSSDHSFQRSWLAQDLREQLFPAVQGAVAELEHAERLRTELSTSFSPRAFEDAGERLARSARSRERFWPWFGNSWREFREEAEEFFVDGLPWWPPRILKPLRRLRTYHRRMANVEDYAQKITPLTTPPPRRKDAWQGFATTLEGCERVASILRLNATSCGEDHSIQLETARVQSRKLRCSQQQFQEFTLDARHEDSLRAVDCDLARLAAYTLDELHDHLAATANRCQDRLGRLSTIDDCIVTDRDVPLAQLAESASLLQRRHKNHLRRQELESDFESELPQDGDNVDWSQLAESIRVIQGLKERIKLPPPLISAMCTPDGLDRTKIAALSQQLGEQLENLRTRMGSTETVLRLPCENPKSGSLGLSAEELKDLLGGVRKTIDQRQEALGHIARLLKVDLPLDGAAEKLGQLVSLRTAEKTVATSLMTLPGFSPDDSSMDWNTTEHKGRWLQQYCKAHGGQIPSHLSQLLSDEGKREELAKDLSELEQTLADFKQTLALRLANVFDLDRDVSAGVILQETSVPDVARWLSERVNDVDRLEEWTTFQTIKSAMQERDAGDFLDQVFRKEISAAAAPGSFRLRFYRTWLDHVYRDDPVLRDFTIEDHEALIQLRRAAASIPANIAEGCGRGGDNELRRFLEIAAGSASEVEYHLLLARDLNMLKEQLHDKLTDETCEIKRMLTAFIKKLRAES